MKKFEKASLCREDCSSSTTPGSSTDLLGGSHWCRDDRRRCRTRRRVHPVRRGQRYIAEIKRELANALRDNLEDKYLAQAVEYQGTNVPLGLLLVLDLTAHPHGLPHLRDTVWVGTARDRMPRTYEAPSWP
jgi:hypothetical protein